MMHANQATKPTMKPTENVRVAEILLVEDSPTDVLLTKEALQHSRVMNNLSVVKDGVDAIAFLRRQPPFADAPRPDIVLLDLNLPRKDGREVLEEIKSDRRLAKIPVIVLTTSKAETDVLKAYDHHANCYIVKPVDFDKFTEVVRTMESFWFALVTLPPKDDPR